MKLGVIGGGAAGLLTTWLLEKEFDVVLFEQQNYLGGHARTIYIELEGKKIPIEIGFEFLNDLMFPNLCKLFKILNVQTRHYALTYSFFRPQDNRALVLPPIQKNKFFFNSLLSYFFDLIQLKYVFCKSRKIVNNIDTSVTLEDFLNSLFLTDSFKNEIFIPFFCAGWGASKNDFKKFSAYNIFSWIVKNQPLGLGKSHWIEIIDGVSSYINVISSQINNAKIITSSKITNVTYNNGKYNVIQSDGSNFEFDYLVIATNANQASLLLRNIKHAESMRYHLDKIEYIDATVAIHSDSRFMPKNKSDWSIANVLYNGADSALTFHKEWKSKTPIFRSWLFPSFPKPDSIYAIEKFQHAKPNMNYFESQKFLEKLQGKNNLWLAGLYTYDIDAHESAIISAINIAKGLASQSQRLINLINQ